MSAESERGALRNIITSAYGAGDAPLVVADAILAAGFTRQSRAEIQAEDPERWRCAMCGYPNADGYQDWARCPICGSEDFEEAPNGTRAAVDAPANEAPDEVLVEGSWFKRKDLPAILGNYMRSCDELGREVKELHMAITELRPATRDAEIQAEAWEAAADDLPNVSWAPVGTWLRDRAQRIREGGAS